MIENVSEIESTIKNTSIIIPTYNSSHFIIDTIDKIFTNIDSSSEIILIDDASSDDTIEKIQDYSKNKENIKIVRLEENSGPGAARNTGFELAQCEYVLFFDSDDIIISKSVAKAISYLDTYTADMAMLSYVQCTSSETKLFKGMLELDENLFERILTGSNFRIFEIKNHPFILRTTNFPWNKIFRRSFLNEIKFSFPTYRLHEDIEPCWHTFLNAKKIICMADPIAYHFVSPFGLNETNKKSHHRLDVFKAVHAISKMLDGQFVENWEIYREFIYFCTDTLVWAKGMVPKEHEEEFKIKVQYFWGSLDDLKIKNVLARDSHINLHLQDIILELVK